MNSFIIFSFALFSNIVYSETIVVFENNFEVSDILSRTKRHDTHSGDHSGMNSGASGWNSGSGAEQNIDTTTVSTTESMTTLSTTANEIITKPIIEVDNTVFYAILFPILGLILVFGFVAFVYKCCSNSKAYNVSENEQQMSWDNEGFTI